MIHSKWKALLLLVIHAIFKIFNDLCFFAFQLFSLKSMVYIIKHFIWITYYENHNNFWRKYEHKAIHYQNIFGKAKSCWKSVSPKIDVPEETKWLSPIVQTTFLFREKKKMLFLFLTFFLCMSLVKATNNLDGTKYCEV